MNVRSQTKERNRSTADDLCTRFVVTSAKVLLMDILLAWPVMTIFFKSYCLRKKSTVTLPMHLFVDVLHLLSRSMSKRFESRMKRLEFLLFVSGVRRRNLKFWLLARWHRHTWPAVGSVLCQTVLHVDFR